MREPKKKPGDAAKARARHLRRQEIQDAISAAQRGEVAPLVLHHHHQLGPCTWELSQYGDQDYPEGEVCLVHTGKNHLHVGRVVEQSRRWYVWSGGACYFLDSLRVLAKARATNDAAHAWA